MYWTGSHTKHRLLVHLVWVPKYRKRILEGKVAIRLEELFRECVEVNRWRVDELNIQPDHVHLLLQIRTTMGICKVVQLIKGGSSKVIREEFPELKEFLWGDSFWADGYFAETAGSCTLERIRSYVRNQ